LSSGQSQIVNVRFSPSIVGSVSKSITFTGGGGSIVVSSGSGIQPASGLSFAATSGTITQPFVANGDMLSQPVETGVPEGGRAEYLFNLNTAGDYAIQISVNAPTDAANSLFVALDADPSDPANIWDILPPTTGIQNRIVGWRGAGSFSSPEFPVKTFALESGVHKLVIIGREADTTFGQISILPVPVPPQNLRVVISP